MNNKFETKILRQNKIKSNGKKMKLTSDPLNDMNNKSIEKPNKLKEGECLPCIGVPCCPFL
jgi:hypothetical protein